MHRMYNKLADKIIDGYQITQDEALTLLSATKLTDIFAFLNGANRIRDHFKGSDIQLCGIVNAKSGRCSENCCFCAQSVHYQTDVNEFPLLPLDEIVKQAINVENQKATSVGIVTSGRSVRNDEDLENICQAIRALKDSTPIHRCASLGIMSVNQLQKLKNAGLERYHHNLETAESFFDKICTTHTYKERIDTVKAAKQVGLKVCSGALFGVGEQPEHRVELAFALRELDVDKIPLNFLNPIPGTPAANVKRLSPLEILKIISLFRYVLPTKDISVCGGREVNLRGLQPLIYIAGANAAMVGNYLTTSGRNHTVDIEDIGDLGLDLSVSEEFTLN